MNRQATSRLPRAAVCARGVTLAPSWQAATNQPITGNSTNAPVASFTSGTTATVLGDVYVNATGFAPGLDVTLTLHSTPTTLGVVPADSAGSIGTLMTLPPGTAPGLHTITLSGFAPDGLPMTLSATINVVTSTTITGNISGDVYLCSGGAPTTTEVPGGTLGAMGPQTVPIQANPLAPSSVLAGTYTMTATPPSGYQLSACGSATNGATQSVVVPSNGNGVGVFYVTPISPCAAGLQAHILTASYGRSTFTGLFCVNAKGVGTYTQGK